MSDAVASDCGDELKELHAEMEDIRPRVVTAMRLIQDHACRAYAAHRAVQLTKENANHYRAVRNQAIRAWIAETGIRPASVGRRLGLARSSVCNIMAGKETGE